jgi:hypothetical protein
VNSGGEAPPAAADAAPTVALGQPLSGGASIVPGQTLAGTLTASDQRLQDGSVGDDYTIMLTAGRPVTIITRGGPSLDEPGETLDVYTLLLFDDEIITADDDSAGYPNSRIVYTPTTTGPHVIRVSTYGEGLNQGHYQLQVLQGAHHGAT